MHLTELACVLRLLEFCARGASQMFYAHEDTRVARMVDIVPMCSAHVYGPLSNGTLLMKHKFEDKIIKIFETVIEEHKTNAGLFGLSGPV